jgi:hypothetical protein
LAGYVLTGVGTASTATGFYSVPNLAFGSPCTIAFWGYVSSSAVAPINVDLLSASLGGFYFNISGNSAPFNAFAAYNVSSTYYVNSVVTGVINYNTWNHFAFVFSNSTTTTLYVNGISGTPGYSPTSQQPYANPPALSSAVNIGTYSTNNTTGQYGQYGYLYGYQQYNIALNNNQINYLVYSTRRAGT